MTELRTERLLLRGWREDDLDPYAALNRDPDVARYATVNGLPPTRSETEHHHRRILAHWQRFGFGLWAVELLESGEMIGFVGPANPMFIPELAGEV